MCIRDRVSTQSTGKGASTMVRAAFFLLVGVALVVQSHSADPAVVEVADDVTAEHLQVKLNEAKAQVETARGRVQQALAVVQQTTSEAQRAKTEADEAEADSNKAKEVTQKHIVEARAAIKAAAQSAQVNDLKQEEEQKELDAEMKLDEKQCGDRVKKWQEDAMRWKGQVDALKQEIQQLKDQAAAQLESAQSPEVAAEPQAPAPAE
eukprot:TRINITY_DN21052_c0_g1_i1.p1 TRINITY_DN21052_c0_g1~~TRINITY_DN21052_c0_g1_i1.p1  ORF type:complete len:207 (-),score=78.59 TRINITY_DN21052_c0_g1_i1:263-883(-)